MQRSTLIIEPGITVKALRKIMAAEKEISVVVRNMGYDLSKQQLSIEPRTPNCYSVKFGNGYVGMWDNRRKAFV